MSDAIKKGDRVLARTAYGIKEPMVAMSGIERGKDFPVIWVCPLKDFQEDGPECNDHWIPWPVEDVEPDPNTKG